MMEPGQLWTLLVGAGGIIASLAGIVYKLMERRITALEAENHGLREEARAAVRAKDDEIKTLRDIAAKLADERAKETARWQHQPSTRGGT